MKNQGTKFRYLLAALCVVVWSSCIRDFFDRINGNGGNGSTIRDIDGNVYTSVKIGEQTWMVENLKVTHYNDGTPLRYRDEQTGGDYAWYNNDITNKDPYGALYGVGAVFSRKLAPKGWHVPDAADWEELFAYLAPGLENDRGKMFEVARNKMQETGNAHWIIPNPNATNESGFTALPAGYIGEGQVDGHAGFSFFNLGYAAAWWRSSYGLSGGHWAISFGDRGGVSYLGSGGGGYFLSVRCLKDDIPKLTTASATLITSSTAKSGGNVITNGGSKIKTAGVCWNTSPNPTVNNFKTIDPTTVYPYSRYEPVLGLGPFTSNLTGLLPGTTYYVRAYATNDIGIAYGQEVSFKTNDLIKDIDGNIYEVVKIGNQVWMAENLRVTHYNDGTVIPNVTDNAAWFNLQTDAYCWYNNDIANKSTYGALYNWYAVNTGKLAPKGWHVPSDEEWKQLEMTLGMTQEQADGTGKRGTDQGTKMKSTTLWWSDGSYTVKTNSSGFTAVAAGDRSGDGKFDLLERGTGWWSSTGWYPWDRYLISSPLSSTDDMGVIRAQGNPFYGLSVRCVKD